MHDMSFTLIGFTLLFVLLVFREVRANSDTSFLLRLFYGAAIISLAAVIGMRFA